MSVLVVQFLSVVNGALLFLVLVLLLRGPAKKFSFVLTYVAWSASPLSRYIRDRIYHGSAVSAGLRTTRRPGFMLISIGLTKSSWICSDFLS